MLKHSKKALFFNIGEGIAEVQLKEWHVKEGDYVNEFDEICSVQSDKASVTITSRYKGIINKLYFQPDDIAKVGQTLLDVELNEEEDDNEEFLNEILPENEEEIKGTGQDGRILKEDIYKMINKEEINNVEIVKELLKEKKSMNLTYLPFFIKIISKALEDFPILNSSLDLDNQSIILKNFHNISIAIDTPNVAIGAIGKIRRTPYSDDPEEEYIHESKRVVNICWAADHRVCLFF
uniref:Dihydrolipoamide acetyltransferase component of pyruvate dehydrogenase complex n=1 Tax=Meloidogyne javanica TaxID=6303 RepID=A0A915M787_MELJA